MELTQEQLELAIEKCQIEVSDVVDALEAKGIEATPDLVAQVIDSINKDMLYDAMRSAGLDALAIMVDDCAEEIIEEWLEGN